MIACSSRDLLAKAKRGSQGQVQESGLHSDQPQIERKLIEWVEKENCIIKFGFEYRIDLIFKKFYVGRQTFNGTKLVN
jgi:hypothetical protein